MAKGTRRPNTVAQAAADAERNATQDAQATIDSVVIGVMREYVIAQDNATEAARIAKEAGENVANVKLAVMLKLAKAAHAGKWSDKAITTALDAAMLVWAGNESKPNAKGELVSPEDRLKTPTARRLRSEFLLAMLPDVRGKAAGIIERAAIAWKEEEALPEAERVLHKAFWDRPAELALSHLRAAKTVKETRGRGKDKTEHTVPGTIFKDRAAMVAAAAPEVPLNDQATAAVNRVLTAILALGDDWNAQELVKPVHDELKRLATAAVLVARKSGGAPAPAAPAPAASAASAAPAAPAEAPAAPAEAPAAPAAPEPVAGASNINDDLVAEFKAFQAFQAMKANSGK